MEVAKRSQIDPEFASSSNVSSNHSFTRKLYDILEDTKNSDIITWHPDGLCFEVRDPKRLEKEILPKFFRHGHFQSLVRQLNFYAFKKVGKERSSWVYSHNLFRRGHPDLLEKLRRKTSNSGSHSNKDELKTSYRSQYSAISSGKDLNLQGRNYSPSVESQFYFPQYPPYTDEQEQGLQNFSQNVPLNFTSKSGDAVMKSPLGVPYLSFPAEGLGETFYSGVDGSRELKDGVWRLTDPVSPYSNISLMKEQGGAMAVRSTSLDSLTDASLIHESLYKATEELGEHSPEVYPTKRAKNEKNIKSLKVKRKYPSAASVMAVKLPDFNHDYSSIPDVFKDTKDCFNPFIRQCKRKEPKKKPLFRAKTFGFNPFKVMKDPVTTDSGATTANGSEISLQDFECKHQRENSIANSSESEWDFEGNECTDGGKKCFPTREEDKNGLSTNEISFLFAAAAFRAHLPCQSLLQLLQLLAQHSAGNPVVDTRHEEKESTGPSPSCVADLHGDWERAILLFLERDECTRQEFSHFISALRYSDGDGKGLRALKRKKSHERMVGFNEGVRGKREQGKEGLYGEEMKVLLYKLRGISNSVTRIFLNYSVNVLQELIFVISNGLDPKVVEEQESKKSEGKNETVSLGEVIGYLQIMIDQIVQELLQGIHL